MTEDQVDKLIERLFETSTPLEEALGELGITDSVLEVEDALMLENLEACVGCGKWLPSSELDDDEEEPSCRKCLSEG